MSVCYRGSQTSPVVMDTGATHNAVYSVAHEALLRDCSNPVCSPSITAAQQFTQTAERSQKYWQGTNKERKCPQTVTVEAVGWTDKQLFKSRITVLYKSRPGRVGLVSKCGTTNGVGELSRRSRETRSSCPNRLVRGKRGNSSVHKITADREAC